MTIFDKLFSRKASGDRTSRERLPLQVQLQAGFGVSGLLGVNLPGTNVNWEAQAGDLSLNSIVATCLSWISRNYAKAHPVVAIKVNESEYKIVDHPLADLLQRPHPNYSGAMLAQMMITDYWTRGNAYCHVVRGGRGTGEPVELHYLPARAMWPVPAPDMSSVIQQYRYYANGTYYLVPNDEIVHIRFGLDPNNLLVGRNPLASALREIVTDNEGATYGAAMVMNGGVPSVLISPKPGPNGVAPTTDVGAARKFIEKWREKTTGDRRGEPLFNGFPVDVNKLAFSPKDMATDEIRRKPEERIPSIFGISPMVLDLGAGLENSTYSNKQEAEQAAYTNCLVPLWELFAQEFTVQLLSLYPNTPDDYVVWFDTRNIAAMQDDINKKSKRLVTEYDGGVAMRSEVRAGLGYDVTPADEIYSPKAAAPVDPLAEEPPPDTGKKSRKIGSDTLPKLEAAAQRYRRALRSHENDAVKVAEDAYKEIQSALEESADRMADAIQKATDTGEVVNESWLIQQERYHSLIEQVSQQLSQFAIDFTQPLTDAQEATITAAIDHTESMVTAALGPQPDNASISWSRLPTAAIDTYLGYASNGSPLRTLLDKLGPDGATAVHNALVVGIGTGETPNVTAGTILDSLNGNRARAVNIARTETLRAARSATIRNYSQNADVVDGWTWLSAMDEDTCAACWAMSGTEHSNSETLDGHPQCRCVPVPRTKSWAEITGDDSLPDERPIVPIGTDVFASLPEADQLTVLGPGLHALYADGSITLADTVVRDHNDDWGTMRRVATIAEAQQ